MISKKRNHHEITDTMKRLTLFLSLFFTCTLLLTSIPFDGDHHEETIPTFQNSPLSLCSFFGDSTTYGLFRFNAHNDGRFGKNYYTLQDSQIWVPKSGTFYLKNALRATVVINQAEHTLSDACKQYRPQKLILTVGINGLAAWEKEDFLHCYEKLIQTIQGASPSTSIYLQSVYPIAPKAKEKLPTFSNEKIDRVNLWIQELANDTHLPYLNTASVLKDSHGNLKEAYHNGDGLHLSSEGFNAMLRYVEQQLTKGTV